MRRSRTIALRLVGARTAAALRRAAAILRQIIGAPDYGRYVAHMHAHHPDAAVLSPRDFERQRLADRYNRPGSRCC